MGAGAFHFGERFIDDRRVVLGQPVAKEHVRYAHTNAVFAFGDERGRLEPGVEAVPVDLGLDAREDLVPDIAADHGAFRGTFASAGRGALREVELSSLRFTGCLQGVSDFRPRAFPQFFPQLWKTSVGTPTAAAGTRRKGDSNIARFRVAIDSGTAGSLLFVFLRSTRNAVEVSKDHEGQTHISAES